MSDILVIGSLNMDMTLYASRFPAVGETLTCSGMLRAPGGKGANQALAAARLGGRVALAGCVGCDENGAELLRTLAQSGVDTAPVQQLPREDTGLAVITVSGGENRILVNPGANACLSETDIDALEGEIAAARTVVLQLEIPLPAVLRAAQLARRHGCTVVLNPAPYCTMPQELLALSDYLIPNETEAMRLLARTRLEEEDLEPALRAMKALGAACPMITLGSRGVVYLWEDTFCRVPANRVQAVDATAAGDTFIGGLTTALQSGRSLPEAVQFAQRAAAYCVAHKGAQPSIPTLEELACWQAVPLEVK